MSPSLREPLPPPHRPLRPLLRRLIDIRDDEVHATLWSCLYFFVLLSSWYVLRPLRDAMGLAGGVKGLPWLQLGTLATMLVAHPLFSALVSRTPRRVFIPLTYRFFTANLLVFYALLRFLPESDQVLVGRAFFVWASMFNLFAVAVFWGLMADLFRHEQGRRLFGFIGVGGTFGAILGSAVTAGLADAVGTVNLLLVAAGGLEVALLCVRRLLRGDPAGRLEPAAPLPPGIRATGEPAQDRRPAADRHVSAAGRTGLFDGLRLVAASPYLLGICAYMLLFTISSTFVYFEQAGIVAEQIPDTAGRAALFARIDLAVNLLTVLLQCFVTGRLLNAIGVGASLALLPAITALGFAGLGMGPVLPVLATFQVVRRGVDYAVARPAREVLYTVLGPDGKYKSKSFIDTFVYRGGDALGASVYGVLSNLHAGFGGVALIATPLALVWLGVGLYLGRAQGVLAGDGSGQGQPAQPAEASI